MIPKCSCPSAPPVVPLLVPHPERTSTLLPSPGMNVKVPAAALLPTQVQLFPLFFVPSVIPAPVVVALLLF